MNLIITKITFKLLSTLHSLQLKAWKSGTLLSETFWVCNLSFALALTWDLVVAESTTTEKTEQMITKKISKKIIKMLYLKLNKLYWVNCKHLPFIVSKGFILIKKVRRHTELTKYALVKLNKITTIYIWLIILAKMNLVIHQ